MSSIEHLASINLEYRIVYLVFSVSPEFCCWTILPVIQTNVVFVTVIAYMFFDSWNERLQFNFSYKKTRSSQNAHRSNLSRLQEIR